jgi:spore coat polysaccharide biosynthesis predicted glycosyltransferase SpsG
MQALASALQNLGAEARLVEIDGSDDARLSNGADVLIVDAYHVDAERPTVDARVLGAVDDLDRDLAVELVVDPNPDPAPHRTRAAQVLHGVDYALVGPIPDGLVDRPVDDRAGTVLVTTGGGDEQGVGPRIAGELHAALPRLEIRLVVGPWGRAHVPEGVAPVERPGGLWDELASADIVVTAGGVTLLEACALGRPTVTFATAANQRRNVAGAVAAGAAIGVEAVDDLGEVTGAVRDLADDADARRRLHVAAPAWVDGDGPRRVAEAVLALA